MTAYITSPFTVRDSLLPGKIGYSFGKFDTHDPGTTMQVTSVAITSNVATVGVTIMAGYVPVVGGLISIQGTQTTTSGGAPNFNVTNVALASVSINSTTGIGTVTFALTSSNITTTADSGAAYVPPVATFDALPSSATAGKQFAVASGNLSSDGQRGLTWFTQFTGSPSTVTMNLQGADIDQDSYYTTIYSSTNVAGESRSMGNVNYHFYRIQAASTGGTNPKVLSGIEIR